jgi:hypothetical protein
MLFTAVLCFSGTGPAAAEPQKNQIVVEASCDPGTPNEQTYTFVINGMSKTGNVDESTNNLVVKQYTVVYQQFPSGEFVGRDEFEIGNKKALQGDLIQCEGETRDPIELEGLGLVTATYDFQAFVAPRGGA